MPPRNFTNVGRVTEGHDVHSVPSNPNGFRRLSEGILATKGIGYSPRSG